MISVHKFSKNIHSGENPCFNQQTEKLNYGITKNLKSSKKVFKAPKKLARKLVPKEAAGIMQMAAPFMGQYAGPLMYGLGSLKQRGRINPLGMALTMAPHMLWTEKGLPLGYGKGRTPHFFHGPKVEIRF